MSPGFLHGSVAGQRLLLMILAVAALGIRWVGVEEPPLELAASRQYRTALIARAMYLDGSDATTPRARTAHTCRAREGLLEPPVVEFIAASLYRWHGAERLWMPRAFNAVVWVAAGLALYLLAAGMTGRPGGLVAAAWFWFLPFGVPASRSLQPDVLMVALSVCSLAAMWLAERGKSWAAVAALAGAAATLIKPMAAFFVLGAWLGLSVQSRGWGRTLRQPRTWLFVTAVLLPAAIYLGWQLTDGGRIGGQAALCFLPGLWIEPLYWGGWLHLVGEVVGYSSLVAAAAGYLALADGRARALLAGSLVAYGLYGLAFSYHIHTHDYYHLPLVPLVALALAPIGQAVLEAVARGTRSVTLQLGLVFVALGLALAVILVARAEAEERDDGLVDQAVRIGEMVGHSEHAILLAPYLGKPLQYHGEISAAWWPRREMLREERLRGQAPIGTEERLRRMLQADPESDYFIVTDMEAWEDQPELRELLDQKFETLARDEEMVIYRLR